MQVNGLQTVEGQNYSLSAASKGYKRYQTMNKVEMIGHLKKKKKCICFINTNARLFCDVRSWRNDVEKVTLDIGESIESVFISWMCKYEVKRHLQKKGVTTQRVYKVKQRCRTNLNLEEKMRWRLHQAWPFQRTWRHERVSQNRRAFVFIKHIIIYFF